MSQLPASAAQVGVGVGVLVFRDGKILLGRRKNSHGAGELAGPGGHVEYGETLQQAVIREIDEECGLQVSNIQLLCVSDLLAYWPKHYLDVGFRADWVAGEPQLREPHKCESWDWYDPHQVPEKRFGCLSAYLRAVVTGERYFTFTADGQMRSMDLGPR